jgi:ABC-2 type transport system ATP-binding protein
MGFGRLAAGMVLAALLALAPPAFARDAKVTSFDGTKISTHFFPAAGLAPRAKAPTVFLGHGYGDRGDTDPAKATGRDRYGRTLVSRTRARLRR